MQQIACAVLVCAGRVLLGKRRSDKATYPACWDLIGGHHEGDEGIAETLVREVEEETGISPAKFRHIGTLDEPHPDRNGAATYHVFVVTAWRGGSPRLLGDEHSELRWFSTEEACALPDLALPQYPNLLRVAAKEAQ